MKFYDFQIRAWLENEHTAQVMVHSSPVGDMAQPVRVPFDLAQAAGLRSLYTSWAPDSLSSGASDLISDRTELSRVLLPAPVFSLLLRSLEQIDREDGLRLRLCLDEHLIDLPWELLYRPDCTEENSPSGYLALDPRIALVRCAPTMMKLRPSGRVQRMLYAGVPYYDAAGKDTWRVREEYNTLVTELAGVSDLLKIDGFVLDQNRLTQLLTQPMDIFHYSGHVDQSQGRGFVIQQLKDASQGSLPNASVTLNAGNLTIEPFYVDALAPLLARSGARLAAFSACNSGRWFFVKELVRAGIPVIIGSQGNVLVRAAEAFYNKLFGALVIGLSLEEAVTWARLHLLEINPTFNYALLDWSEFMVYMPSAEAVLFPKAEKRQNREQQAAARAARQQTIVNVYQNVQSLVVSGPAEINNVNTGGGAYIKGNLTTGGDFIGRDQVQNPPQP